MLRKELPIIFEILGEKKLSSRKWKNLNGKYILEYNKRYERYIAEDKKPREYEVNLYDVLEAVNTGRNWGFYVFKDLLKCTLEELCDALTENDKLQLRETLYSVLINFDHKYRNFIGELLVLNNLVKKQDYQLIKIESPITETTSADFLIKELNSNKTELVEVVNINIGDNNSEPIRFITGKLENKFISKTKNADTFNRFTIVPVIWASYSVLKKIEALYDEGKGCNLPYALEPCAFATYDYDNNKFVNKFGRITTMFKSFSFD